MDIPAKDVPAGRFFAVNEPLPNNVYVMRVPPRYRWVGKPVKGQKRRRVLEPGMCQNIATEVHYCIMGNHLVRLIREDEHDQTVFHVGRSSVLALPAATAGGSYA